MSEYAKPGAFCLLARQSAVTRNGGRSGWHWPLPVISRSTPFLILKAMSQQYMLRATDQRDRRVALSILLAQGAILLPVCTTHRSTVLPTSIESVGAPGGVEEASVMMTGLEWNTIHTALGTLEYQPRDKDVSEKVARVILSYTEYVNRVVWRK